MALRQDRDHQRRSHQPGHGRALDQATRQHRGEQSCPSARQPIERAGHQHEVARQHARNTGGEEAFGACRVGTWVSTRKRNGCVRHGRPHSWRLLAPPRFTHVPSCPMLPGEQVLVCSAGCVATSDDVGVGRIRSMLSGRTRRASALSGPAREFLSRAYAVQNQETAVHTRRPRRWHPDGFLRRWDRTCVRAPEPVLRAQGD